MSYIYRVIGVQWRHAANEDDRLHCVLQPVFRHSSKIKHTFFTNDWRDVIMVGLNQMRGRGLHLRHDREGIYGTGLQARLAIIIAKVSCRRSNLECGFVLQLCDV